MRYALLSDIHGNLEALQAVLKDIDTRSIDKIVCLGDIVGYYPDPEKCVELIKECAVKCVAGNHDYAAIGRIDTNTFTYYAFVAMEWTKKNISAHSRQFLETLPLQDFDGDLFFAHASPYRSQDWAYVFPDSEEVIFEAFNNLSHRLNFIGHTHWPSIMLQENDRIILLPDRSITTRDNQYYLVNVGSVGQPRDFDSRSSYAIYDSEKHEISLTRVKYDYHSTQKKIIKHRLPQFLAERLEKWR